MRPGLRVQPPTWDVSARESGNSSPRAVSVSSADITGTASMDELALALGSKDDKKDDTVKVYVRVRPVNEAELRADASGCVSVFSTNTIRLARRDNAKADEEFVFDQVFDEATSQEEIFNWVGRSAVDNCMSGLNSAVFAYGQTGAGKTHTMLGRLAGPKAPPSNERGLAPRVFDYLFAKVEEEESTVGARGTLRYSCRCSFLEIYNETITDLLHPNSTNLQIREDNEKGPFVEGLSEHNVQNAEEVLAHLRAGAQRRHIGATRLNAESSRSHSVFTCMMEKSDSRNGNSNKLVFSRLNLIDLAGSERVGTGALGGSQAQGEHLKEAAKINSSLSTLGRVIKSLVEVQAKNVGTHVPYRDSKLTFLLQQSLGGNAKTIMIANVSPSMECSAETLGTLQFVQRAKSIRNMAKVNWVLKGDPKFMAKEIERLNAELESLRQGRADPLIQRNLELSALLDSERNTRERMEREAAEMSGDNRRMLLNQQRIERVLKSKEGSSGKLEDVAERLAFHFLASESAEREARFHVEEASTLSAAVASAQLQDSAARLYASQAAHAASLVEGQALRLQLDGEQGTIALQLQALTELDAGKRESDESCAALTGLLTAVRQVLQVEKEAHAATAAAGASTIDELNISLSVEQLARSADQQTHTDTQTQSDLALQAATQRTADMQAQLSDAQQQLSTQADELSSSQTTLFSTAALLCQAGLDKETAAVELAVLTTQVRDLRSGLGESTDAGVATQQQLASLELQLAGTTASAQQQVASLEQQLAEAGAESHERQQQILLLEERLVESAAAADAQVTTLELQLVEAGVAAQQQATLLEQQLQDTQDASETVSAQLSAELSALQTQLLQAEESCADAEDLSTSQGHIIDSLREEAGQRAEQQADLQARLESVEADLEEGSRESAEAAEEAAAALASSQATAVEQAAVIEQLQKDAAASLAVSSTVESELQGNAADLASTIAGLREAKADLLHCLDEKMTEAQALSTQISQLSTASEDLRAQLGRAEDRTQALQDTLDQSCSHAGQRVAVPLFVSPFARTELAARCALRCRTQAAMVASEFNVASLTAKLEERFTELLASNLRVAQAQEDIDGHRAAGVVRDRDTAKARKAASDAAAAEEQRTALAHEAALEAQQELTGLRQRLAELEALKRQQQMSDTLQDMTIQTIKRMLEERWPAVTASRRASMSTINMGLALSPAVGVSRSHAASPRSVPRDRSAFEPVDYSPNMTLKVRQSGDTSKLRMSAVTLDTAHEAGDSVMVADDESSDLLATNDQQD
ncbi:MAG: hypothetical protein WDW38_001552 [Sanguina aurantia]